LPYHDCVDIAAITWAVLEGEPPAERPADIKGHEADLWDLVQGCWDSNPKQRPVIDEAVKRLGILSENL
jgi:hypothetical protein